MGRFPTRGSHAFPLTLLAALLIGLMIWNIAARISEDEKRKKAGTVYPGSSTALVPGLRDGLGAPGEKYTGLGSGHGVKQC